MTVGLLIMYKNGTLLAEICSNSAWLCADHLSKLALSPLLHLRHITFDVSAFIIYGLLCFPLELVVTILQTINSTALETLNIRVGVYSCGSQYPRLFNHLQWSRLSEVLSSTSAFTKTEVKLVIGSYVKIRPEKVELIAQRFDGLHQSGRFELAVVRPLGQELEISFKSVILTKHECSRPTRKNRIQR